MIKMIPKLTVCAIALLGTSAAHAGLSQFVGDVVLSGENFCPRNSLPAEGQLLPISSNATLYSLVGTAYGGDGRVTFALPDLRGRVAPGMGQLPGGQNYILGQKSGDQLRQMSIPNMPSHNHALQSSQLETNSDTTTGALLGDLTSLPASYYHNGTSALDETMKSDTVTNTGSGTELDNRQPIQAMRWCIYTAGDYPQRN